MPHDEYGRPTRRITLGPPPPPPPPEPSFLQRMAPTAMRLATGLGGNLIGSAVPVIGAPVAAGIAGLGEGAAQLMEGGNPLSKTGMARMAVEGGIAAVPGGSLIKGGKMLLSAGRGAAMGGIGQIGRQVAEGRQIDLEEAALPALAGALTGGVVGKLSGPRVPKPPADIIEDVSGKRINRVPRSGGTAGVASATPPITDPWKSPQGIRLRELTAKGTAGTLTGAELTEAQALTKIVRNPGWIPSDAAPLPRDRESYTVGSPEGYTGGPAAKSAAAEAKALKIAKEKADAALIKAANEAAKVKMNADKLARIEGAAEGMTPGGPSISESVSATTPSGASKRMSVKYAQPEEDMAPTAASAAPAAVSPLAQALGVTPEAASPDVASRIAELEALLKARAPQAAVQAERRVTPGTLSGRRQFIDTSPDADEIVNTREWGPVTNRQIREFLASPKPQSPAVILDPSESVGPSISGPKSAPPAFLQNIPDEQLQRMAAPSPGSAVLQPEVTGSPRVSYFADEAPVPAVPPVPEPTTSPLSFLKGDRVDISGENYRNLQKLLKGGEQFSDPLGLGATAPRLAGAGLRSEAKAAGLPTGPEAVKRAVAGPGAPSPSLLSRVLSSESGGAPALPPIPPKSAAEQAAEAIAKIDAAKGRPGGGIWNTIGSQRGAISPGLQMHLGTGLAGAAIGSAMDEEDRVRGGVIGGTAGLMVPQGIKRAMQIPQAMEQISEAASTQGGLMGLAKAAGSRIPEVQRFNYLADPQGLLANAVVGPYGSGALGALESRLGGDSRGVDALRELAPWKLPSRVPKAFDEATEAIGRAEGKTLASAMTPEDKMLAVPGTLMTTGDKTIVDALMDAGYSLDEAKLMTMTNEPTTKLGEAIVNLSRTGGPIAQTLAPFVRTPVNIMEQGVKRLPLLGLAQAFGEAPPSLQQLAAQQGMSGALSAGGYLAGNNMTPEEARVYTRFLTNAAGRYSLPVGAAIAAGQANRAGRSPLGAAVTRGLQNTPLPTTDTLEDLGQFITGGFRAQDLPRGMAPRVVRDAIVPQQLPALTIRPYRTQP